MKTSYWFASDVSLNFNLNMNKEVRKRWSFFTPKMCGLVYGFGFLSEVLVLG